MYERFYGLKAKPFSILPDPDFIYWSRSHALAFGMMEYGVLNGAGFTVITGDIGCGKTTLIQELLRTVSDDVTIGVLNNTGPQDSDLLRWILLSLGQPFEADSSIALYKQFADFLHQEYEQQRHVLLIIDEAQNLGAATLEELRLLSNLNANREQLLQLILVGQPELKSLLEAPELRQFAQRVSSDFHIGRFGFDDFNSYVDHRLEFVGGERQLFTAAARKLIFQASDGVPRSINIICDTALIYGYANKSKYIYPEIVEMLISDKEKYGVFKLPNNIKQESGVIHKIG